MFRSIIKIIVCVCFSIYPVFSEKNADRTGNNDGHAVTVPDTNPYTGGYYNCTWTAWNAADEAGYKLPGWHNAGVWAIEAAMQGFFVSDTPAENSIAVWSNHVAFVKEVLENGNIYVEEGGASIGHRFTETSGDGSLYRMTFIGYIYLPITEIPEGAKRLPLLPLLEKAQNVNINISTEQIARRQIEINELADKEETLAKERENVTYVEEIKNDSVKSDEPNPPRINMYMGLPKNGIKP